MNNQEATKLTDISIPNLISTQLDKFTSESVQAKKLFEFNPNQAEQSLLQQENKSVIGIDMGGDKVVSYLYRVKHGKLETDESFSEYVKGDGGEGFLASFERTSKFASEKNIPIGISYGAPMDGASKPKLKWPKFKIFLEEIEQKYNGDFTSLFPTLAKALNDAPAGLVSGAVEAYKKNGADNVLYVINGSGMNVAALAKDKIIGTEAGHVESIAELNIFGQNNPCKVDGATYVCLEALGANKFGIESLWLEKTGEDIDAKEIEDRYTQGNELARDLYGQSALVVAHMIKGSANVVGIDLAQPQTAVVCHGGAFRFPRYAERIQQILEKNIAGKINLFRTEDYTKNACAEGAAIAALTAN